MSSRPDPGPIDSAQFPVTEPPEDLLGDLKGADLSGRDLRKLSLRGRDLTGAHLEGARLEGADLRDAGLSSANLSGATLTGARLEGADLSGADLSRAELSGAVLDGATLARAILHDTTLRTTRAHNSSWVETEARDGDWRELDLRGSALQAVDFHDLDIRDSNLVGVRVDDSDLARVRLSGADLEGVHLTDCTLEDVEVRGANLTGAELRFANLDRVDFEGAQLDSVRLESIAFRACRLDDVSAQGATVQRCAGLTTAMLQGLRDAGALVALPLPVRLWRALGNLPGGRATALLLAVVVAALLIRQVAQRSGGAEVGTDDAADILASADESTRQRWEELEEAYESDANGRVEVLRDMAILLERLTMLDEAEERLREAVGLARLRPEMSSSSSTVALGRFLLRHGRQEEAFDLAREAIDEATDAADQVSGYVLMARTRLLAGDSDGALAELSTVTGLLASGAVVSAELWLDTAIVLEELGEVSAALSVLRTAPVSMPTDDRAVIALARAEMLDRAGNPTESVRVYDSVIREFEGLPLIVGRAREARTAVLSGGPDPETEARQLEGLAAADDPELAVQGELGLARLAMRMGSPEVAVRRYERIIDRFAERPELALAARRELAGLHLSAGRTDDAVALLEAAEEAASDPDTRVDVREDLSRAWEVGGEYEKAKRIAGRSIEEFSDDPELVARAQLQVAGIADSQGAVEEALGLYRAVSAAQTESSMTAAALFGEATLLRRIGKVDAALPLMDQAMEVLPAAHPMRGDIAVERAETLVELGQSSVGDLEAMLSEARVAGLESAQPVAYGELLTLLAHELIEAERAEDALAVYQRVAGSPGATEDPGLKHTAVEGQVASLVALGRREQADALLEGLGVSAMSSGEADDNCDAAMSLARSRAEIGALDEAASEFTLLLDRCRSPLFLVLNLPVIADAMAEGGRTEEVQGLLRGIRDAEISAVGRQAALLELGRLGDIDDLEVAMTGPDRALASLARIERGEQLERQGRLAEAEPLWEAVLDDEAAEPLPRSLALLGLARLEMARSNPMGARGHIEEVRVIASEDWILAEAERLLAEVKGTDPARGP